MQNATATIDRNLTGGAFESNGLVDGAAYHEAVDYSRANGWMGLKQVAEAGGKISRVRVLTERIPMAGTFCDISYVHATLPNGQIVNVDDVNVRNMTPMNKLMGELINWAKSEGVYAKGLGLLDRSNWSVL
ncbi:hypothetical protein ACMX2H_16065 [Arthrobacter sulfonylureivorans]|uniref:hypothetical protein n=1 Tax=Arthrobacter sulfonylureivorans TaxID=2486855 RepID=UPI0039E526C1